MSFLCFGPVGVVQRDREAAEEGRRHVVRMALELGRQPQQGLAVEVHDPLEQALAAITPETIAAPEDPRPRLCGMTLAASSRSPGSSTPASANAWAIECTTRFDASVGTSPAPTPRDLSTSVPPRSP